ncbi:MAG TPA: ATP-binding protein [Alphaproteobacteria bacterium]|jgi:two-component system nitrogen regulation sensor histidine kinase GlnL|nr:ATP-binding protein [Alphaproteobacteria bacterium]
MVASASPAPDPSISQFAADPIQRYEAILNALADPVVVVGADERILLANSAAEQFFQASAVMLLGRALPELLPGDSPLFTLLEQARESGASVSEYGVTLETPKIGSHLTTIQVAPIAELPGAAVIALSERSIANKMDRQLTHRNAARSVTAMAAILAHEVKNPLSGIRGAAQLLEQNAGAEDRSLTRLIITETDRICALVDRMDMFAEKPNIEREGVNIHQVLEHVRRIAQSGFARHVRITENYDPSLPPVFGNRDQLIQVFLNLVKNAAEAVPEKGGEIALSTAYQPGMRLAVPGSETRTQLPLVVSVSDNGDGIPETLRANLFDPFVTTKVNGTGLGLALVAKIVGDHDGIIEFSSQPRRTVFRVYLPIDQTERQ